MYRLEEDLYIYHLLYISVLYWVYKNAAISTPKMSSATDRMIFTLQCHALTIAVLLNIIVVSDKGTHVNDVNDVILINCCLVLPSSTS